MHQVGVTSSVSADGEIVVPLLDPRCDAEGGRHLIGQGIPHFRIGVLRYVVGLLFRRGKGAAVVAPFVHGVASPGTEDAEILPLQTDVPGNFPHFRHPEGRTVVHFEEGHDIAEIVLPEIGIVVPVPESDGGNAYGLAAHDLHHAGNGMGGIAHGVFLAASGIVGAVELRKFLPDDPGGPLFGDLPQGAAGIQIVGVFRFRIDEIAEKALPGHSAAEHGLGAVDGGFPQHIFHARALDGLDDLSAPVQHLIVVGKRDHGNGGIDVLARFQRLEALGRVKLGLGDDDDPVAVRSADFVQRLRLARKFCRHRRIFRDLFHPVGFRVAENDRIHQRMRSEKRSENAPESTQSHQSQFDPHFFLLPVELFSSRSRVRPIP